ncbi:MAG: hypothetical protein NWQ19_08210 [Nonlabens sp.]|nr:hypothetical protein [Nonlabens sp.]
MAFNKYFTSLVLVLVSLTTLSCSKENEEYAVNKTNLSERYQLISVEGKREETVSLNGSPTNKVTTSISDSVDNAFTTFSLDNTAVSTGSINLSYAAVVDGVTTTSTATIALDFNGIYTVVGNDTDLTTSAGGLVFIKELTAKSLTLHVVDLPRNIGDDFVEGNTSYKFIKL